MCLLIPFVDQVVEGAKDDLEHILRPDIFGISDSKEMLGVAFASETVPVAPGGMRKSPENCFMLRHIF